MSTDADAAGRQDQPSFRPEYPNTTSTFTHCTFADPPTSREATAPAASESHHTSPPRQTRRRRQTRSGRSGIPPPLRNRSHQRPVHHRPDQGPRPPRRVGEEQPGRRPGARRRGYRGCHPRRPLPGGIGARRSRSRSPGRIHRATRKKGIEPSHPEISRPGVNRHR